MSRTHNDVASDPVVRTAKGEVRGTRTGDIRRFAGIPFALPPFGDRRFALPEDVPAWDGVRDATAFGPTAPQDPYYGAIGELLGSIEIPGDDILTVNVWSPATVPDGGLPVMVWYPAARSRWADRRPSPSLGGVESAVGHPRLRLSCRSPGPVPSRHSPPEWVPAPVSPTFPSDAECARSRRVRPLWGACRGRARRERARSARSRGEVARRGRGARTAVVLRR